jgi:drug/metabolite transporter (DMT)-like permease
MHIGDFSLLEQAVLLPKSAAMTASWICAYYAVRELPLSIAGAIRASGPLWTFLGGMVILGQFLRPVQIGGLLLTVASYHVLSVVGRREGIYVFRNSAVYLMLVATVLSALTTVYDRFIVEEFNIPLLGIQVYTAVHRFLFGAIVFSIYMVKRETWGLGLNWSWAIPFVGISWTAAEFVYFYAVFDPNALVAHLAVLRRSSLIVAFGISASFFHESNVKMKCVMIGILVIGMALLLLG